MPVHWLLQILNMKINNQEEFSEENIPKEVELILLMKLLRFINVYMFLNKIEILIKYVNFNKLIQFRIAKSFFWLIQTTHFFACFFVFYNINVSSGYFRVTSYDIDNGYMKYTCGL